MLRSTQQPRHSAKILQTAYAEALSDGERRSVPPPTGALPPSTRLLADEIQALVSAGEAAIGWGAAPPDGAPGAAPPGAAPESEASVLDGAPPFVRGDMAPGASSVAREGAPPGVPVHPRPPAPRRHGASPLRAPPPPQEGAGRTGSQHLAGCMRYSGAGVCLNMLRHLRSPPEGSLVSK